MFKKYRFDYNKNNGIKDDNLIGAVSKFVKIQKNFGISRVEQILRILRNAWYGEKYSLSSAIISGLSTFLSEHPEVDEMILTKALEKVMPNMLIHRQTTMLSVICFVPDELILLAIMSLKLFLTFMKMRLVNQLEKNKRCELSLYYMN